MVPELIEEDVQRVAAALRDFIAKSEADLAIVAAEGGFVLFQEGKTDGFDVMTLASLAANAFAANQAIAELIHEPNFTSVYQQGEKFSLLVNCIDPENSTLIVVFPAHLSVGVMKYYATAAGEAVAAQLESARHRAPGQGFDPAMLNLETSDVFKRK